MSVESMTAGQVMSCVLVAVKPAESPLMAWELMRRAGVHHLPVVEGRQVVGILTREKLAASWSGGLQEQSTRSVRELLDKGSWPWVGPGAPLVGVAAVMLDAGVDAVPVLTGDGLIGLITARDVLSAVAGRTEITDGPGDVLTGMFHLEPVLPSRGEPVLPTRSWREA